MMFLFDDKEQTLRDELKKEVKIPFTVQYKANEAYRMIQDGRTKMKAPQKDGFRWMRTVATAAAAAAAILTIGFVFCATNPVMAKELPLVGGLFEQLQDHVSFFGNFSDKAAKLEETASESSVQAREEQPGEKKAGENQGDTDSGSKMPEDAAGTAYTKSADGLTISFSEVYANSQAIYLTMEAKSEKPFPDTDTMISSAGDGSEHPVINMTAQAAYSFREGMTDTNLCFFNPEGMFLDENTYACILRLDLAEALQDTSEYEEQYNAMTQEVLDEMGITQDDLDDSTEEGYALLEEYVNKISERGGSLKSYIKDIPLPDSFHLNLDIQEFVGTLAEPEYWDSGYTPEELEAMSDEEWRDVMSQMPAEYNEHPNEHENYWFEGSWSFDIPVTVDDSQTITLDLHETNDAGIGLESVVKTPYELTVNDLYEDGAYSDTFLVALDANGNKLPYNDSNGNCNNFTIQDRDISTVDIYILDYVQYMDELKGPERYNNNENKPKEEKWSTLLDANALYHKTIHFDS